MISETVFLAFGTNLGEREANLDLARRDLSEFVKIEKKSSIYETPPGGVTDQPAFLNQVLVGETSLSPQDLLTAVKRIEKTMGRLPSVRFGPRLIDIDILLYGDTLLDTPDLTIPHARMFERAFVLVPLLEIAPDLVSPLTREPVADILTRLDTSGIKRMEDPHA
jgi:2-amino-4-hydroxy-6-hydroxymethyldihydropteridine diphosphokinase